MTSLSRRLRATLRRGRARPVVYQAMRTDCGIACLAMVLRHHGRDEPLAKLRQDIDCGATGATLQALMQGAAQYGLAARAVRVRLDQLGHLALPAILHWDFNHFVTLEAVSGDRATIADPARGRQTIPIGDLSDCFTGVAIEFRRTARLERGRTLLRTSLADLWTEARGFKSSAALVLALALSVQLLALAAPLLLSVLVDRVPVYRSDQLLLAIAIATVLSAALGAAGDVGRRWLLLAIGNQLGGQVSLNFVNHLIRVPYLFFQERRLNDVMSRADSIRSIKDTLVNESVAAVVDGGFSLLTLTVIAILSPVLAAMMLGTVAVYTLARVLTFPAQRHRLERAIDKAGIERGSLMETVRGIQTIKVLNAEAARLSAWQGANLAANAALVQQNRLTAALAGIRSFVSAVDLVLAVFVAMILVLRSDLTLGALFAIVALRQQFQDRAFGIVDRSFEFGMIGLHLDRIADVTRTEIEPQASGATITDVRGAVAVESLRFRYSPDDPWVLDGVSFAADQGEFVAICGPSGGGKTTLARLMLGLLTPTEGCIRIDGRPLDPTTLAAYRANCSAVLQDDQLFSGTVLENIASFDPEIDLERVAEAAKEASVYDDIMAMKTGFYSQIGDMGSILSGGQRQRILLARALYRRPRVLFLDEGTANLDAERERRIVTRLKGMGITLICIAHRSATLEAADRVYELRQGRLSLSSRPGAASTRSRGAPSRPREDVHQVLRGS